MGGKILSVIEKLTKNKVLGLFATITALVFMLLYFPNSFCMGVMSCVDTLTKILTPLLFVLGLGTILSMLLLAFDISVLRLWFVSYLLGSIVYLMVVLSAPRETGGVFSIITTQALYSFLGIGILLVWSLVVILFSFVKSHRKKSSKPAGLG